MNNFRTTFPIAPAAHKIQYNGSVLTIGSCFSDTMAERLQSLHFDVCGNPTGVLFNPFSIGENIRMMITAEMPEASSLFFHDGLYRHFSFPTQMAHPDKDTALSNMRNAISLGRSYIEKCSHLIITFGTTILYRHRPTGKIAANNHKLPAAEFERIQQEPVGVLSRWIEHIKLIRSVNPGCSIWFTVSPVRHTREGMAENNWSKAVAILSIHQLCKHIGGLYYFPAYELMIDDLRDYRFYAEDMIHPNAVAIDYIFDAFRQACIDPNAYELMDQMSEVNKAMEHRPLFPGSEAHSAFNNKMLEKIAALEQQYPHLDLGSARLHFSN